MFHQFTYLFVTQHLLMFKLPIYKVFGSLQNHLLWSCTKLGAHTLGWRLHLVFMCANNCSLHWPTLRLFNRQTNILVFFSLPSILIGCYSRQCSSMNLSSKSSSGPFFDTDKALVLLMYVQPCKYELLCLQVRVIL